MAWYWLSFADPNRPRGSHFLGAVLIEADDFMEAVWCSRKKGLNPGGEVLGAVYPPEVPVPPDEYRNRLLDKATIARMEVRMAN